MTKVKSFLAGVAFSVVGALPVKAQPKHDWYILNFKNVACMKASHLDFGWDNPLGAMKAIRKIGKLADIKEIKDEEGKLFVATVRVPPPDNVNFYYFPSLERCLKGKNGLVSLGDLPDVRDLQ